MTPVEVSAFELGILCGAVVGACITLVWMMAVDYVWKRKYPLTTVGGVQSR